MSGNLVPFRIAVDGWWLSHSTVGWVVRWSVVVATANKQRQKPQRQRQRGEAGVAAQQVCLISAL